MGHAPHWAQEEPLATRRIPISHHLISVFGLGTASMLAETASSLVLWAVNTHKSWLTENAALVVGVVGILVSGLVGPSVAAVWTSKREREKDERARLAARQDDLRDVVDDAAKVLGDAVPRLRAALGAQIAHQPLPVDVRDFLAEVFTLGQRLRLRVAATDQVVTAYDAAREQLKVVSEARTSQNAFDDAAKQFAIRRAEFLDYARKALSDMVAQEN